MTLHLQLQGEPGFERTTLPLSLDQKARRVSVQIAVLSPVLSATAPLLLQQQYELLVAGAKYAPLWKGKDLRSHARPNAEGLTIVPPPFEGA